MGASIAIGKGVTPDPLIIAIKFLISMYVIRNVRDSNFKFELTRTRRNDTGSLYIQVT